jgi:GNAT superfamily N-acetyltransferase
LNWNKISNDLKNRFSSDIKVVIPDKLTEEVKNWYHEIDNVAFRDELHYSDEEIQDRWNKSNSQFIFLLDNSGPIAVHIGYDLEPNSDTYYIDTLATKVEGKGIGSVFANYIKEYAKNEDYTELQLDTEVVNERGLVLKHFYEKNGFKQINGYPDGNITMKLKFL